MSSRPDPRLLDARGVEIAPGDTVIYGFGVGRSVAMAEAVVVGDAHVRDGVCPCSPGDVCPGPSSKVSLTPSGRVRLRVIRRSYSSGEKPVVDVLADRVVVLKRQDGPFQPTVPDPCFALPPSPLPTQAELARVEIERRIKSYTEDLRSDTIIWGRPHFTDLADFHAFAAKQLKIFRKKLRDLDD